MRRLTQAEIEEIECARAQLLADYKINDLDILATVERECRYSKFWLGRNVCSTLSKGFCKQFFAMTDDDAKYFEKLEEMAIKHDCDEIVKEFFHELANAERNGWEPDDFLFDFGYKWREAILNCVM